MPKAKGTKYTPPGKSAESRVRQHIAGSEDTFGESVSKHKEVKASEDNAYSVDDRPIFLPDNLKESLKGFDSHTFEKEELR